MHLKKIVPEIAAKIARVNGPFMTLIYSSGEWVVPEMIDTPPTDTEEI
jgi:hypothetical protein